MKLARTMGNRALWLFLVSFVLGMTALIQAQEQEGLSRPTLVQAFRLATSSTVAFFATSSR
jgi:hypothetical protein